MKKSLKLLCLACSIALITGCSAAESVVSFFGGARQQNSALKETYDLYETITIPTHTFKDDSGSATVKGVVIMPDGSSSSVDSLSITQIGQYEVRYSATIGDKNYSYSENFLVKKPLFQYSNATGTSVTYSIPQYAKKYTDGKGVYVALAKGDTLTINEAIDLSSSTKQDKIINLFATPYVQGEFDFAQYTFTLTDSENPSIKMTILCNAQAQLKTSREYVYFRAGGENQTLTGKYTNPNNGNIVYQTKGFLGGLCKISLHAAHNGNSEIPTGIDPQTEPVYFAYDAEDIALHIPAFNANKYPEATEVSDFDDPAYYKSNLWNGFPSKKAYLSITCGRFTGTAARFCITSILGVDLNSKYIEDNNAPVITPEFTGLNMPEGQIGIRYKIPKATAFDVEEQLNKDVTTKVFYNYGSTDQISIPVINNEFIPDRNGSYYIEYSSKDLYGNVGIETLKVHVGNVVKPIDFDLPSIVPFVSAGNKIDIPDVINPTGGVGEYVTTVFAEDSLGIEEIGIGDYIPRVVGTTIISYVVTDYNGNAKEKSASVEVMTNTNPVFLEIANLEEEYLTEFSNLLPSCLINVVEDKKVVQKVCDVEVIDYRGNRTYSFKDNNETFKVYGDNVDKTATLNFKYNDTLIKTKTINLVESKEDGYLNMANYFSGTNFTSAYYSTGAVAGIEIKNTSEVSEWKYFNKLTARDAKVIVNKRDGESLFGFNNISIKFTDSLDPSYSITFKVFNDYFNISTDHINYTIDLLKSQSLSIAFDKTSVYVNNISFVVKYFDNGEIFNNFPSEKVKLSVTTTGSNSDYVVTAVSNFLLYKMTDNILPDYVLTGDFGGSYSIGSDYYIHKMIYSDVVKPYSKAYLSVLNSKEYVTAKDGTVLNKAAVDKDYIISLENIGIYNFIYTFEGEDETFSYAVYSLDNKAPEISITSEIPSTVSYGSKISIPSFTVSDDYTASEDILIIVSIVLPTGYEKLMQYTLPNEETGKNELKTVSESIVAQYRGSYKLKITAIDAAGNSSFKFIEIVVK